MTFRERSLCMKKACPRMMRALMMSDDKRHALKQWWTLCKRLTLVALLCWLSCCVVMVRWSYVWSRSTCLLIQELNPSKRTVGIERGWCWCVRWWRRWTVREKWPRETTSNEDNSRFALLPCPMKTHVNPCHVVTRTRKRKKIVPKQALHHWKGKVNI